MRNTNPPPSKRIWLYIGLLTILFVVLIILVMKQGAPSTSPNTQLPLREQEVGGKAPDEIETTFPSTPKTPRGRIDATPSQEMTNEQMQQSGGSSTSNNNNESNTKTGSNYAVLSCSVNLGKTCTIKRDDTIFSLLGQDPDTELLVNGAKIKPENIVYQTSSETYTDEQMKDGQGTVLSSTNKEYDVNTKTLTISIGASPNYYNNLRPTEQRLLYLSQTVRSFMAMFGETPENFVKVEKVVNELGSWQPTP